MHIIIAHFLQCHQSALSMSVWPQELLHVVKALATKENPFLGTQPYLITRPCMMMMEQKEINKKLLRPHHEATATPFLQHPSLDDPMAQRFHI